jgi:hypothetical protein
MREAGAAPEPVRLEGETDDAPMAMRPVKDLDVCPNCGAPMRSIDEVVCLRCGFDLKTMKQVKVATGVVEVDREQVGAVVDENEIVRKPIVTPGRGDTTVPLIMAGVAGLILILGYLGGASGLFPPIVNSAGEFITDIDPTFRTRMLRLLEFIISDAMWTACALGSLAFLAFLLSMRFDNIGLAAARMLGIVTVAHLVTFLNLPNNALESICELIVGAGVFVGLSIVLFGLKPKDTPILLGSTVILYMILRLGAWVVVSLG